MSNDKYVIDENGNLKLATIKDYKDRKIFSEMSKELFRICSIVNEFIEDSKYDKVWLIENLKDFLDNSFDDIREEENE